MKTKLQNLEKEIEKIKARNKRVELDKSWETSFERKIAIFILTYIVVVVFFIFAGLPKPFVNSIIPAIAFLLSTMTLPLLKNWWTKTKNP